MVCGEDRLTLAPSCDERVNRLANALLALGLQKGDKLALVLPNCIELLYAYRAAAALGIVAVPLSPLLRGSGLVIAAARFGHRRRHRLLRRLTEALDEARGELPEIPAGQLHPRRGAERPRISRLRRR